MDVDTDVTPYLVSAPLSTSKHYAIPAPHGAVGHAKLSTGTLLCADSDKYNL